VKRWARHFGLVLGIAATTGFVFYAMHALRGQDLSRYLSASALGGLALAAAGYSLVIPMSALAWRGLLGDMGVARGWGELSIIMGVSQLAKYIPGNIGQHVGRAAMAFHRGIPLRPYGVSVLSETVLAVIAATVTGVVGCGFAGMGSGLWTRLVGAALPSLALLALVFVLAVVAVRRLLPRILQRLVPGMRDRPMAAMLPGNRAFGVAFAIYVLNYAVLGAGLTAMVLLLLPGREASWLLLTGCFALAWVIGFFAPGVPAGLGVREGLLLALLQFSYTRPDALLVVIALRLATTAGDVLCFLAGAAALLLARRRNGNQTPHSLSQP
jgi:glycosyltransferase 2 family protein